MVDFEVVLQDAIGRDRLDDFEVQLVGFGYRTDSSGAGVALGQDQWGDA